MMTSAEFVAITDRDREAGDCKDCGMDASVLHGTQPEPDCQWPHEHHAFVPGGPMTSPEVDRRALLAYVRLIRQRLGTWQIAFDPDADDVSIDALRAQYAELVRWLDDVIA